MFVFPCMSEQSLPCYSASAVLSSYEAISFPDAKRGTCLIEPSSSIVALFFPRLPQLLLLLHLPSPPLINPSSSPSQHSHHKPSPQTQAHHHHHTKMSGNTYVSTSPINSTPSTPNLLFHSSPTTPSDRPSTNSTPPTQAATPPFSASGTASSQPTSPPGKATSSLPASTAGTTSATSGTTSKCSTSGATHPTRSPSWW